MKLQIRQYDKILILNLEEMVGDPDLVQMATAINAVASKIAHVIVDVNRAQLGNNTENTLARLKAQYEKAKIKMYVVSAAHAKGDGANLVDALDAINTNESGRVVEIFTKEPEFLKIQQECNLLKTEVSKALQIPPPAEGPIVMDVVYKAFNLLDEKNKQLQHLHETFSKEILALQKQREGAEEAVNDPGAAQRVAEAKRKALELIKTSGALN